MKKRRKQILWKDIGFPPAASPEESYSDLALEERERIHGAGEERELSGVWFQEWKQKEPEVSFTLVEIRNAVGEREMKKPRGRYLTMESSSFLLPECREQMMQLVGEQIYRLLPKDCRVILVAGLGNRNMTADALGPVTVEQMMVTRKLYPGKRELAACAPGVLAATGMESAEILAGVLREIGADVLIAVDALAARNSRRLGRTIQLSDTGIRPGAGIGNHRMEITKESVGVPVIAIGVPTVISAASLACDVLGMISAREAADIGQYYRKIQEQKPELAGMYVAPKDMDELVAQMGDLLAGALETAAELS